MYLVLDHQGQYGRLFVRTLNWLRNSAAKEILLSQRCCHPGLPHTWPDRRTNPAPQPRDLTISGFQIRQEALLDPDSHGSFSCSREPCDFVLFILEYLSVRKFARVLDLPLQHSEVLSLLSIATHHLQNFGDHINITLPIYILWHIFNSSPETFQQTTRKQNCIIHAPQQKVATRSRVGAIHSANSPGHMPHLKYFQPTIPAIRKLLQTSSFSSIPVGGPLRAHLRLSRASIAGGRCASKFSSLIHTRYCF